MKIANSLIKLSAALSLFAIVQGSAQAVVINTYTDATSWTNNVGASVTEDFNDLTLQAPLQSIDSAVGSIVGGVWDDELDPAFGDVTSFNFNPGVYGIGGDWDLTVLGVGTGITVNTVSGSYLVGDVGVDVGFWGFTINESIMSVELTASTAGCCRETYTLDNLLIATAPVPEPAILALMGLGLAGIGFSRRKRNA